MDADAVTEPSRLRRHDSETVRMVNEDYDPDSVEDAVIDVLRREQRANPYLIREQTDGIHKQAINSALRNLCAAGWVSKVTRGLYDFVEDPRVSTADADAERASTPPESPVVSRARDALAAWDPTDVDSTKARRATVAAVAWLAAQDGEKGKAEIVAYLETSEAGAEYAETTLWQKVVRPGLRELVEAGLVTHRRNVGYEVVENSDE